MSKSVIVLIPIYRESLSNVEFLSLQRTRQVLGNHTVFFVAPEGRRKFLTAKGFEAVYFPDKCMNSLFAYNKLLMSRRLYERFQGFEYILICQLDVWVFHDSINEFVDLPYDYIGAPTIVRMNLRGDSGLYGGNGGFSLRRVRSFMRIIEAHKVEAEQWKGNEDEFFSFCGEKYPEEFRVAPPDVAMRFSFDRFSRYMYRKNQERLPMAWHGWLTYDPEFSRRFIVLDHMQDIETEMNLRTYTDAMKKFHSFVGRFPCIYIYGAGLWGKAVFHYLRANNVMVKGFIVSDGQPLGDGSYHGTSIRHLSEISGSVKRCGVVFSIGKRYLPEETTKSLEDNIRNGGFEHLLYIDAVTYNGIVEELLAFQE